MDAEGEALVVLATGLMFERGGEVPVDAEWRAERSVERRIEEGFQRAIRLTFDLVEDDKTSVFLQDREVRHFLE